MFSKLCVLAVVIPFISALTLNPPTGPVTTSGSITLTWTSTPDDQPSFSLELVNEGFHDTFAIANNVPTDSEKITLTLPSVPVNRQYTIAAVNISNVNDVLATTPPFNIGPEVSSSSEASSSTSKSSGNSSGSSGPSISAMPPVGASSSSFGVTRSNTATGTNASPTNSAGSSSGANAPTGTNFGNSGLPVRLNVNKGFIASAALSLVAGAAIVAL